MVGKSDSGKTFFIKRELIPFLNSKKVNILYFSNCDKITTTPKEGVAIIDEAETFQDREFLEKNNTAKKSYYNKQYIQKVNDWFKKLKKVKIPSIYIVTRNNTSEINHFKKTIKATDFDGRETDVVVFSRRTAKN